MTETRPIAIVTGAAGDIGRAIAVRLIKDGYRTALADIDPKAAEAAREIVDPSGENAFTVIADVTNRASSDAMVEEAASRGPVSLLVTNAGAAGDLSSQSMTDAMWQRDIDLNLTAHMVGFKSAQKALIENKGSHIAIASVNGIGFYGHPAYSAAKAGLIHLVHMLAAEFGRYGVRVNAVAPGTVKTQAWQDRAAINPNVFEDARRWYPLQRIAEPGDVANAVAFLASGEAAAITGVCLPVDCGLTAGLPALAHTFTQSDDYPSATE